MRLELPIHIFVTPMSQEDPEKSLGLLKLSEMVRGTALDYNYRPELLSGSHSGEPDFIPPVDVRYPANCQHNSRTHPERNSSLGIPTISTTEERHSKRAYISVGILCFINLINYMDRFTVAGVLTDILSYYKLDNSEAGLLQTVFIVSYMIMAPIFGYLGDRYSRKLIMGCGVLFWSLTTLLGSFIPSGYFGLFMVLRGFVGTGEASYSTIAPTIIADLFFHSMRSKMLAIFYFAIPVGSGLGYIAGSEVAHLFGDWHWALRVTPVLGFLSVILIFTTLQDPPRGEAEGGSPLKNTNLKEDLQSIITNHSFIWSTAGFTCVAFAVGALAWWAPSYMTYAINVQGNKADKDEVSLIFGIITCVAGITGVVLGSGGAQYYRRFNPCADPLVCAFGVLASVPLVFAGIAVAHKQISVSWALIFFGETFLCMNWPIVADILLYCVIPTRRSMAEAVQILISHMLGDACSPYIIGAISDAVMDNQVETDLVKFTSLQYALYTTTFILAIGGLCFLVTAWYIVEDRERCDRLTHGEGGTPSTFPDDTSLPSPVEGGEEEPDVGCSISDECSLIRQ
ncbi:protein spinster homolog 1-like isoform X2 [Limulus polyphemus]|uniref:Protein spinster homolog 1-like isoform X2 n=1 Tax=Limulus polyphemus TaxID=6850 RepID=A0ABM1B6I1_LIMPO|nr:protein spinster homolog 1-like isoform X2 [Limulus polyphemus]